MTELAQIVVFISFHITQALLQEKVSGAVAAVDCPCAHMAGGCGCQGGSRRTKMAPGAKTSPAGFGATLIPETCWCTRLLRRLGGLGCRGFYYLGSLCVVFFFAVVVGTLEKHVPCSGPGIQRRESCQAEKCLFIP